MAVRKDRQTGRWLVEFQQANERVLRRLPSFATKADAQALESKLRREIWERTALGVAEEPTLAEAIQEWLKATHAGRKDKLNPARNAIHLEPFVRGKTLRQIGEVAREAIKAYTSTKSAPTQANNAGRVRMAAVNGSKPQLLSLSPATINRRLDVLRASARWAWKQGMIAEDLSGRVPRLREENARQVYLNTSQIRAISRSAPNSTCRAAIMIAAYTGLRASELLALPKTTSRQATLSVATSKTGRPRVVPIAGPVRPFLSALPLDCSYRLLIKWFHAARKKAGMKHVRWHDLRHTTASLLINSGADLYTVGKILGHSSPLTTARYSHLSQATLQKAMRRLK